MKDQPKWTPQPKQRMAYFSDADEIFFGGAAGGGKGLSINTNIPTLNGFKIMEDVVVGDVLFDEHGQACSVLAVSEINHRDVYRIEFDDGSFVEADDVHKWLTFSDKERAALNRRSDSYRSNRRENRASRAKLNPKKIYMQKKTTLLNKERVYEYKSFPTGTIRSTLDMFNSFRLESGRSNYSINLCKPLQVPSRELLPVDPYTMGVYLGDGASLSGQIGMMRTDLDEVRRHIPYNVKKETIYRAGTGGYKNDFSVISFCNLRKFLVKAKVIKNKHIPMDYLFSSFEQRVDLLQGILDTDGHCNALGQIELGLSDYRLARDVYCLICSLGIKTSFRTKKTKRKDSYVMKFVTDIPCFKLKSKMENQKRGSFRSTTQFRYVVDIKKIESIPTKCISVDSPSHLYLAGEQFIPTHNSDLLLAIPYYEHDRAIIFRREYKQLRALIDRSRQIYEEHGDYNKTENRWTVTRPNESHDRIIEFGACQHIGDEEAYQGIPHDFIGFDEITHFTLSQYKFLTGWNRSAIPGQRCRVICTGNPPTDIVGEWVVHYWRAWLDPEYPNPAIPGELRWYTTIDGEEQEVDGKYVVIAGERVRAKSRTFIPSKIEDNTYLMESGYKATLQSLPEPFRSKMLFGDFGAGREDNPYQVIPREWVLKAQRRWKEKQKSTGQLCSVGVDVSRGGKDRTVLTLYFDDLFVEKQICIDGKKTSSSVPIVDAIKLIMANYDRKPIINVDVIGVGGAVYDGLVAANIKCVPLNSANKSEATDKSGKLSFKNKRAEWWWKVRELLDPEKGSAICIPDDAELCREICAPNWKLTAGGLQIESKDDIIKRIGRSIDKADSFIYAVSTHENVKPAYMAHLDIFSR